MTGYRTLEVEPRGPAEWLTLARPERLNAVDSVMREELHHYLDGVSERDKVRVIVLRGAGRGFCAGLDLREETADLDAMAADAHRLLGWQRRYSQLVIKLRRTPQPVVALVNGPAAGLGFSLALAADLRIAVPTAVFAGSFITVGFSGGDCGSSYHLPRIVGSAAARELLLTGRPCSAARALALGLVSDVVEEAELERAGQSLVDALLATGPTGLRLTKDLLNASETGLGLEEMIAIEDRTQMYCLLGGDPAEGIRAFREKRPPRFTALHRETPG
jgi:enoyl-CoA hydratase/carnithine racemase